MFSKFKGGAPSTNNSGLTRSQRDEFLHNRDKGKVDGCGACYREFDVTDEIVSTKSAIYHVNCFTCGGCAQRIDANTAFVEHNGKPHHTKCVKEEQCVKCSKALSGKYLNVEGKKYHKEVTKIEMVVVFYSIMNSKLCYVCCFLYTVFHLYWL